MDAKVDWYWLRDHEQEWIPVTLHKTKNGKVEAKDTDGNTREINEKDAGELQICDPSALLGIEDMTQLVDLSEAAILSTLRTRFNSQHVYTRISTLCLSVNPFQFYDIYGEEMIQKYHDAYISGEKLEPHLFAVAAAALNSSFTAGSVDQAVIISGESGAGKTEAAKLVLRFVASICGAGGGMESKVLGADPMIEAFGNAKTSRNDNSSRFGKWLEILLSSGAITGLRIINYLLEKSRVVCQNEGERNYHIFYMLLAGIHSKDAYLLQLHLNLDSDPSKHRYLEGGKDFTVKGYDEYDRLLEVFESMVTMQYSDTEKDSVFKILAAILHLGDCGIQENSNDDEASVITNPKAISEAARLLGVDSKILGSRITTKSYKVVGEEELSKVLNKDAAQGTCDALCKALYGGLFDWMIEKINQAMQAPTKTALTNVIGILDIYGFESFQRNSFEQFCINFSNEMLQRHFNQHIFGLEQEEYKKEGIDIEYIEYIDNSDCIDLIKGNKTGIIHLIDEVIRMPKSTDELLLERMHIDHGKNPCYVEPKIRSTLFSIRHYAMEVVYDITGFIVKSQDPINHDLVDLIQASTSSLVAQIIHTDDSRDQEMRKAMEQAIASPTGTFNRVKTSGSRARPKASSIFGSGKHSIDSKSELRTKTVGNKFKSQLDLLMLRLNSMEPHFIRCIKPTSQKLPNIFEGDLVLNQMRYLGLQALCELRQTGFPLRITHEDFSSRFSVLITGNLKSRKPIYQCKEVIKLHCGCEGTDWVMGKTKVFLRFAAQNRLETLKLTRVSQLVTMIQSLARGRTARKALSSLLSFRAFQLEQYKRCDGLDSLEIHKAINQLNDINACVDARSSSSKINIEEFFTLRTRKAEFLELRRQWIEVEELIIMLRGALESDIENVDSKVRVLEDCLNECKSREALLTIQSLLLRKTIEAAANAKRIMMTLRGKIDDVKSFVVTNELQERELKRKLLNIKKISSDARLVFPSLNLLEQQVDSRIVIRETLKASLESKAQFDDTQPSTLIQEATDNGMLKSDECIIGLLQLQSWVDQRTKVKLALENACESRNEKSLSTALTKGESFLAENPGDVVITPLLVKASSLIENVGIEQEIKELLQLGAALAKKSEVIDLITRASDRNINTSSCQVILDVILKKESIEETISQELGHSVRDFGKLRHIFTEGSEMEKTFKVKISGLDSVKCVLSCMGEIEVIVEGLLVLGVNGAELEDIDRVLEKAKEAKVGLHDIEVMKKVVTRRRCFEKRVELATCMNPRDILECTNLLSEGSKIVEETGVELLRSTQAEMQLFGNMKDVWSEFQAILCGSLSGVSSENFEDLLGKLDLLRLNSPGGKELLAKLYTREQVARDIRSEMGKTQRDYKTLAQLFRLAVELEKASGPLNISDEVEIFQKLEKAVLLESRLYKSSSDSTTLSTVETLHQSLVELRLPTERVEKFKLQLRNRQSLIESVCEIFNQRPRVKHDIHEVMRSVRDHEVSSGKPLDGISMQRGLYTQLTGAWKQLLVYQKASLNSVDIKKVQETAIALEKLYAEGRDEADHLVSVLLERQKLQSDLKTYMGPQSRDIIALARTVLSAKHRQTIDKEDIPGLDKAEIILKTLEEVSRRLNCFLDQDTELVDERALASMIDELIDLDFETKEALELLCKVQRRNEMKKRLVHLLRQVPRVIIEFERILLELKEVESQTGGTMHGPADQVRQIYADMTILLQEVKEAVSTHDESRLVVTRDMCKDLLMDTTAIDENLNILRKNNQAESSLREVIESNPRILRNVRSVLKSIRPESIKEVKVLFDTVNELEVEMSALDSQITSIQNTSIELTKPGDIHNLIDSCRKLRMDYSLLNDRLLTIHEFETYEASLRESMSISPRDPRIIRDLTHNAEKLQQKFGHSKIVSELKELHQRVSDAVAISEVILSKPVDKCESSTIQRAISELESIGLPTDRLKERLRLTELWESTILDLKNELESSTRDVERLHKAVNSVRAAEVACQCKTVLLDNIEEFFSASRKIEGNIKSLKERSIQYLDIAEVETTISEATGMGLDVTDMQAILSDVKDRIQMEHELEELVTRQKNVGDLDNIRNTITIAEKSGIRVRRHVKNVVRKMEEVERIITEGEAVVYDVISAQKILDDARLINVVSSDAQTIIDNVRCGRYIRAKRPRVYPELTCEENPNFSSKFHCPQLELDSLGEVLFQVFDQNRDGLVSEEDLTVVCDTLGMKTTTKMIKLMIKSMEDMGVENIIRAEVQKGFDEDLARDVFMWLSNKEPKIGPDDIRTALETIGEIPTSEEIHMLMELCDFDNAGFINVSEFRRTMTL